MTDPWIWLQTDERGAEADACTCRLDAAGPDGPGSGAAFYMCPLHEAARDLLAALGVALKAATCPCCGRDNAEHPDEGCTSDDCPGVAAIAKARQI